VQFYFQAFIKQILEHIPVRCYFVWNTKNLVGLQMKKSITFRFILHPYNTKLKEFRKIVYRYYFKFLNGENSAKAYKCTVRMVKFTEYIETTDIAGSSRTR